MAEAAKALGMGGFLPFRGKRYALKSFDLDGIAAFECYLENRAWEAVERTKFRCDPEAYRERHDAVARLVASGAFSYGGEIAAKAAASLPGQKFILLHMLQSAEANKDMGVDERLVEDVYTEMFAEAKSRMDEANADPNSPAPESLGQAAASPISPPDSSTIPGNSFPGKLAA